MGKIMIDGETVQTYLDKLDYKITATQERIQLVKEMMREPNFFTKFFSCTQYGDRDMVAVTRALDTIADYMMANVDGYATSQKMDVTNRQESGFTEKQENQTEVLAETYGGNYYLPKKQKIFPRDFKDFELKGILGEYQKYKVKLQKVRDKAKVDRNGKLKYKCDRIIGALNKDMIAAKNSIKQPIEFCNITPTPLQIEWLCCDYTNEEHIRALLSVGNRKLSSDLGILTYDLEKMLTKANLSKLELKVVHYLRSNEGATQTEIADELGYTQQYINLILKVVAAKIAKYNRDLE